jgi:hypothetical protein
MLCPVVGCGLGSIQRADEILADPKKEPQAGILALAQRISVVCHLPATIKQRIADAQSDRNAGLSTRRLQVNGPRRYVVGFRRMIDQDRHAVFALFPIPMRGKIRSGVIGSEKQKGRSDAFPGDLAHQLSELLMEEMGDGIVRRIETVAPFLVAERQKALGD